MVSQPGANPADLCREPVQHPRGAFYALRLGSAAIHARRARVFIRAHVRGTVACTVSVFFSSRLRRRSSPRGENPRTPPLYPAPPPPPPSCRRRSCNVQGCLKRSFRPPPKRLQHHHPPCHTSLCRRFVSTDVADGEQRTNPRATIARIRDRRDSSRRVISRCHCAACTRSRIRGAIDDNLCAIGGEKSHSPCQ